MFEQKLTIFTDRTYGDKSSVITALSELVADKVTKPVEYAAAVEEREEALSTYIEYGVAIPHAKTDAVKTPFVVYEKLTNGVAWGEEGEIAHYVFMIGVPKEAGGDLHLRIISELSKNLMRDAWRESFLNAATPEEALEMLKSVEKEIIE